jgi:DNA-3-methyladenine glycosylase
MEKLKREFFDRKPELVARALLGKLLVRVSGDKVWVGKVVETEAYLGPGDKASHSHKGMTPRNEVMFGPPGFAYIYFTYGMHWLLNFITESEGQASGVLIRSLEPIFTTQMPIEKRISSGPAKLTKWMGIDGKLNKTDITKSEELFVAEEIRVDGEVFKAEKVQPKNITATTRIGVDYAEEHKNLILRFYINDNQYVSRF